MLDDCTFPPLAPRYDRALREAVAFVLDEVEPIGIIATGTIIRGNPHASSDLDVYVLHTAPYRRRVQRFFNGVPAEILINPPHTVRRYFAEDFRDARPISAHMVATGFVVLDRDPVIDALRKEAQDWLTRSTPMSVDDRTRARYATASLLEDGVDVVDTDPATASMLLTRAVVAMLELVCKNAHGRLPRPKELIGTVAEIDPEAGALAQRFFAAVTTTEKRAAAELLADRTIEARGFFEWDSGDDPVNPPAV